MKNSVGRLDEVVDFAVVLNDEVGQLATKRFRGLGVHSRSRVRLAHSALDETFNAMLINAGVTHPLNEWLDWLESGGRLMLPLTGSMPAMGANIGKGLVWQLTKQDGYFDARVLAFVAIYSAIGLRDETLNERLGKAMMAGPAQWQGVKRLRRDRHEPGSSCWLHGDGFCFSREN